MKGLGIVDKNCPNCGETKPENQFYTKQSKCKICCNAKSREYAAANKKQIADRKKIYARDNKERILAYLADNKERISTRNSVWHKANSEKVKAYGIANRAKRSAYYISYAEANKEKCRSAERKWAKQNPGKRNANTARRQSKKLQATPLWGNEFFIEEAYSLSSLRTKILGFKWNVDHSVPLRSKIVCGLHVDQNLQVIPAVLNHSKGNRHWENMP